MLPSDIAHMAEDEALSQNRPPDVARYYALLAALDAVFLNVNHNSELTHDLAAKLGVTLPFRRTEDGHVVATSPGAVPDSSTGSEP